MQSSVQLSGVQLLDEQLLDKQPVSSLREATAIIHRHACDKLGLEALHA